MSSIDQFANNVTNQQPRSVKRTWTTDLFDFSESKTSDICYVLCCSSCYRRDLARKANEPWYSCFCPSNLRTKIRTERGIEGSVCLDFLIMHYCRMCALLQMDRELEKTSPLI